MEMPKSVRDIKLYLQFKMQAKQK